MAALDAEELVRRLTLHTARKQQCPLPSGTWSASCGDLPRCSIGGNGSCVLRCESIRHGLLPLQRHASCDLRVCSDNLTLGLKHGALRFLCESGQACPE